MISFGIGIDFPFFREPVVSDPDSEADFEVDFVPTPPDAYCLVPEA